MPEGDTLARIAIALRPYLAGRVVTAARARLPGPQVSRIVGQKIDAVDAAGKNLLIKFDGGLELRTHLGLHGSWHRYRPGETWRRPPSRAALVIEVPGAVAVCFDAPVVELFERRAEVVHPVISMLGPDLLAPNYDQAEAVRRLRDPARAQIPDRRGDPRPARGRGRRQRVQERGAVHREGRPVRAGRHARRGDARASPHHGARVPAGERAFRRSGRPHHDHRHEDRQAPRALAALGLRPRRPPVPPLRDAHPRRGPRAASCRARPTSARAARPPSRRPPAAVARTFAEAAPPPSRSQPQAATAYSRRSSSTPFRACMPRSTNEKPDPATRSRTDDDTSTSPGPRGRGDPRADVHRDARGRRRRQLLDLAGVDAGPHLEADLARRPRRWPAPRGSRAQAHRTRRGSRRRPYRPRGRGIASSSDADGGVVVLEQVAPAPVAEPRRQLGGADDVGEQDRREHPIRLLGLARPGEELADLGDVASGSNQARGPRRAAPRTRAPAMCSRQPARVPDVATWSPTAWMISVGTWIVGTTSRTSMSNAIRANASQRAGVAALRWTFAHHAS